MTLTAAQQIELKLRAAQMAKDALAIGDSTDPDLNRMHLVAVAQGLKGIDEALRKFAAERKKQNERTKP